MNTYTKKSRKRLGNLFDEYFFPVFLERIESEIEILETIGEGLQKYLTNQNGKEKADLPTLLSYNSDISAYLNEIHADKPSHIFEVDYPELFQTWDSIFEDFEPHLVLEQPAARFKILESDRRALRFIKRPKIFFYHISRSPNYLANSVRKLFKKPKKRVKFWKYKVPVQNQARHYFKCLILRDLNDLFVRSLEKACNGFNQLKKIEEDLIIHDQQSNRSNDLDFIIKIFKDLVPELRVELSNIIDNRSKQFDADFLKTGTIELGSRRYRESAISKRWKYGQNEYKKQVTNWNNTLYALFEEWRTDLELLKLNYQVRMELEAFKKSPDKKFKDEILPKINEIGEFITESHEAVEKTEDLRKCLVSLRYNAVKRLDKEIIPRLAEVLASKSLHNHLNGLENSIENHLEEVAEKRVAVETNDYNVPVEEKDINQISLNELISFEMLPKLKSKLGETRSTIFNEVDEVTRDVNGMDQIIIFTLTSSLSSFEKKEKEPEEIRKIVLEGFERARDRLKDVEEHLKQAYSNINEQTDKSISDFLSSVVQLMDAENIINIRLRLTKAKAIAQSEQLREKISKRFIKLFSSIKTFSIEKYQKVKEVSQPVTRIFFPQQSESAITREVVDFLNSSQQIIGRLPLIYKRLYEIEPLEDLGLFEGRSDELNKFEEAHESWKNGKFAATVVVGEKWGGNTSFINHATSKIRFDEQILRLEITESLETEAQLVSLFNQLIKKETFKTLDECVQWLTTENIRRVIILEDIQNLFLRRIDGFNLLKRLFEVITQTCKQVFWVCTCTIYAWKYLKNVIQIDEYFNIAIELDELTNEQIVNVISKRNRISGYKIIFSEEESQNRKMSKMDDKEKQVYLKDRFFNELTRYAKSNVSLALIYWLLSTRDVNENRIVVGEFKEPDLSFLSVLSSKKVHVLQALILHDGLTAEHLNEVINEDLYDSSLLLTMLFEDGIVILKDNRYMVSPLVFRSVINLLKSKNLIY